MPVTINVNGLTLVHKASEGISQATLPDVCLTPPGVPVPYPNISFSKDLADGTTTVLVDGGNMAANLGSMFATSIGDEPGVMGGVKSGVNMKESTWLSWSQDVMLEGRPACRLTDKMWHNRQNTVNMGGEKQESKPKPCEYHWPDGSVIGAGQNGKKCGPVKNEDQQGVMPPKGSNQEKAKKRKIVYINGITINECGLCYDMQMLAKKFCAEVIGIYNKTDGMTSDLTQAVGDKMNLGNNPASDSLSNVIENSVRSGESLEVMAHSQGALITSRAMNNAQNEMASSGYGSSSFSNVQVTTYGGAAYTYPSGPSYDHYVNTLDPVPQLTGKSTNMINLMNPNVHTFTAKGNDWTNHGLHDVYLKQMKTEPCS